MSTPKYHHLIPQTYMKSWCYSNKSIYIVNKESLGQVTPRNIESIAGIRYYHTIKAGMPCCNQFDTELIFRATKDYIIKFRGNLVSDTMELNKIYSQFNDWEITRLDGSMANRKALKNTIDSEAVTDIETLWSKLYENDWGSMLKKINQIILGTSENTVREFDKKYLMEFFVALDWRSFATNNIYNNLYEHIGDEFLLKSMEIPKGERIYPFLETMYDELYHCSLLNKYRDFLNGTGMMFEYALKAIEYTSFHFYIATGNTTFITSDNPSFIFTREDGLHLGVLPISPRILMIKGRNSNKEKVFYVSKVTDDIVKKYNKLILDSAVNFIILDNPEIKHF